MRFQVKEVIEFDIPANYLPTRTLLIAIVK